jgi:hypothetical protein
MTAKAKVTANWSKIKPEQPKKKKITAEDLIAQAEERAKARTHPDLHNHKAPIGYHLRGVSTLLDAEGAVKQTWVKTVKTHEDPMAILDAFQIAVAQRDIAVAKPVKAPKTVEKDLLTTYYHGDAHVGMLSWAAETGEDFNLEIAERNIIAATNHLVDIAPPSEYALIINVGDFFHADNVEAKTARSGHSLDVDSRWAKVLRIGISILTQCIDKTLTKHKYVKLICSQGNHDPHSSIMLSTCLAHHYRNEPRVTIETSPSKFHWHEFGKNLFGITHGDMAKPSDLPGIMAHDKAEAWGRTKYRFWFCGHIHHTQVKEYPGVLIESFRTLAARDAWHAASGYRAGRSMISDVFHVERGRILRHEVGIESL